VAGRVVRALAAVAGARDDLAAAHHHAADRHLAARGRRARVVEGGLQAIAVVVHPVRGHHGRILLAT
jgi:hypothetical protein